MLILFFSKIYLSSVLKIQDNKSNLFLYVNNNNELKFTNDFNNATLWVIESSILNNNESTIKMMERDLYFTAIENNLILSTEKNSFNQKFMVILDDIGNFQLLYDTLYFVDVKNKRLILRNKATIPAGFTLYLDKGSKENFINDSVRSGIVLENGQNQKVVDGKFIHINNNGLRFKIHSLLTASEINGINYSEFPRVNEFDIHEIMNDPDFINDPSDYIDEHFNPETAEHIKIKFLNLINYLKKHHHINDPLLNKHHDKMMLHEDDSHCSVDSCEDMVTDYSTHSSESDSHHYNHHYHHHYDEKVSLSQAMNEEIGRIERIHAFKKSLQDRIEAQNNPLSNDGKIKKRLLEDEKQRYLYMKNNFPDDSVLRQGPVNYIRKRIEKKLAGYNTENNPEVQRVLKYLDKPLLRNPSSALEPSEALKQLRAKKDFTNDARAKTCQKYARLISNPKENIGVNIYTCPVFTF